MNQIERRGMTSTAMLRIAGVGLLACMAYMIGTQGLLEPAAHAFSDVDHRDVTVNNISPPAIVLNSNERAIVGAANGVFYVVDFNGNAVEVRTERSSRLDENALLWRSKSY